MIVRAPGCRAWPLRLALAPRLCPQHVTVHDEALRPGCVASGILRGDRGQPVDVPVEHAERGRDQDRVVDLQVRRACRAGFGYVFCTDLEPALLYRRGDR